jgi:hypothetical protein
LQRRGIGVRVVSWNHAARRELRDTADKLVDSTPASTSCPNDIDRMTAWR